MTERKPPGVSFESWIDRQIREAMERGEFDNLPGAGKPIPDLDKATDELWWIRQKMRSEGLSTEAALPTRCGCARRSSGCRKRSASCAPKTRCAK